MRREAPVRRPLAAEERVEVFARVLAAPFDLEHQRRTRQVFEGRADRREVVWMPLLVRWAQRRLVDDGVGCSTGPVRVHPLRLVRRKRA